MSEAKSVPHPSCECVTTHKYRSTFCEGQAGTTDFETCRIGRMQSGFAWRA
jgi:hypothetical protein